MQKVNLAIQVLPFSNHPETSGDKYAIIDQAIALIADIGLKHVV